MQAKVLIADDIDVNRVILSAILGSAGFDVLQARDGEEALRMIREQPPDLVLLDVMMPKLDGWQVLAAIKGDATLREIPVVFITAKGETADKIRGLELGAADYVAKPFDAEEVLARARTQVRLRQLARSLAAANAELRARQALIDDDLRAAADIQRALVPRGPIALPGLRGTSFFLPSQHVGGDIFSLHRLDPDHAAIWILDVSGHGVGAAMMTVTLAQRLSPQGGLVAGDVRLHDPRAIEPSEVLARLDVEYPMDRFDRFFTIAYLVVDLRTGVLRYSSAGHPPPLLHTAAGELRALSEGGTIIGLGTGAFPQGEVRLRRGDRLFLYTDGVADYQGRAGASYGEERLLATIAGTRALPLEHAVEGVLHSVLGHGSVASPEDDLTLLVIEWDGAPPLRLSLQLDSRLEEVRRGAARLREFWTGAGVDAADQDALELCFVEAGNNSVIHAYGGQQGIEILVESSVAEDAVVVVVRDHGAPMPADALDAREPREGAPILELAEGGRGGLLLHSLADELRIDSGADGNVVLFRKLRTPSSRPP